MFRPDEIVALRISQGEHFIGQAFHAAGGKNTEKTVS
jgi:hypothetical protein